MDDETSFFSLFSLTRSSAPFALPPRTSSLLHMFLICVVCALKSVAYRLPRACVCVFYGAPSPSTCFYFFLFPIVYPLVSGICLVHERSPFACIPAVTVSLPLVAHPPSSSECATLSLIFLVIMSPAMLLLCHMLVRVTFSIDMVEDGVILVPSVSDKLSLLFHVIVNVACHCPPWQSLSLLFHSVTIVVILHRLSLQSCVSHLVLSSHTFSSTMFSMAGHGSLTFHTFWS
jgi:hypothetical protein